MTTAAPATAPGRAGRHRSAAADDAILGATLDLLAEKGYHGVTMAAVIERAGVSSATLYRRWTTKHDLVTAAVASLTPAPIEPDTGSLNGDLYAFARHYADTIAARREDIADGLMMAARSNTELAAALTDTFQSPRLRQLQRILERAVERGELDLPPVVDVLLELVAGPIYYRTAVLRHSVDDAFVRRAVAGALAGLAVVSP